MAPTNIVEVNQEYVIFLTHRRDYGCGGRFGSRASDPPFSYYYGNSNNDLIALFVWASSVEQALRSVKDLVLEQHGKLPTKADQIPDVLAVYPVGRQASFDMRCLREDLLAQGLAAVAAAQERAERAELARLQAKYAT